MRTSILAAIVLCFGLTGCTQSMRSGMSQRPDGIDVYVQGAGFDGLVTRRNASPAAFLGLTPRSSPARKFADADYTLRDVFTKDPAIDTSIPADVSWDEGNELTVNIIGKSVELGGAVDAAFANAELNLSSSLDQQVIIQRMKFLRLDPSWVDRWPSRDRSEEELDEVLIVSEIMQADKFSLVRTYQSPTVALKVRDYVSRQLGVGDGSVHVDAGSSDVQLTIQNSPLIVGVKLTPLKYSKRSSRPTSRENLAAFGLSPVDSILRDPEDAQVFCRPISSVDGSIRMGPRGNIVAADDGQGELVLKRSFGTPLRLDLVQDGRIQHSPALTNYLLQLISPSDVAFCQVTVPDPVEFFLDPKSRRAFDGGIDDATVLATSVIGTDEYQVFAQFYDESVASRYQAYLQDHNVTVSRNKSEVEALFKLKTPIVVAGKTAPWGQLQRHVAVEDPLDFASIFSAATSIWTGEESPQQLMLLRGPDGARITEETTPYLKADPGSTRVLANTLAQRRIALIRNGKASLDNTILDRLLGHDAVKFVSAAQLTVVDSVLTDLNPRGCSRIYPRGVWVDTSREYIITKACSIGVADFRVEASGKEAASIMAARFQSLYPQATVEVQGSDVSVRNAQIGKVGGLKFVSAEPLDSFVAPSPSPVFRSAGVEVFDDDKYLAMGQSGFGLLLEPTGPYQWWGATGFELSDFPVSAQLCIDGIAYGASCVFRSWPGTTRTIAYDIRNDEVLELRIGAIRVLGGNQIGCEVEWRLHGKPSPFIESVRSKTLLAIK